MHLFRLLGSQDYAAYAAHSLVPGRSFAISFPDDFSLRIRMKSLAVRHYNISGAHRTGREHVTPNVHSIDGEIQTWRTYYKYSSFRIWIFYDETGNI